jgi:hypothetical protein
MLYLGQTLCVRFGLRQFPSFLGCDQGFKFLEEFLMDQDHLLLQLLILSIFRLRSISR